jgi:hypothetical protein
VEYTFNSAYCNDSDLEGGLARPRRDPQVLNIALVNKVLHDTSIDVFYGSNCFHFFDHKLRIFVPSVLDESTPSVR